MGIGQAADWQHCWMLEHYGMEPANVEGKWLQPKMVQPK